MEINNGTVLGANLELASFCDVLDALKRFVLLQGREGRGQGILGGVVSDKRGAEVDCVL